jgi:hypothetical protein
MNKILKSLGAVILLTSACAKNSNQMDSSSNLSTTLGVNVKPLSDAVLGSYKVESVTAKTTDGDFKLIISGLVETREILRVNGSLVIKQKSIYKGCTREITSPLDLSFQTGSYTRRHFTHEHCEGTCPVQITGNLEGHSEKILDEQMACGNNLDHNENGGASIVNGRLLFEFTDGPSLVESLVKIN